SSFDVACHVTLRLGVIHAMGDHTTLPSRGAFGPLPARAGLQDIELAMLSQGGIRAVATTCQLLAKPVPVRLMMRILVSPLASANPPLGLKYGCAFSSDKAGARQWHGKN